MSVRLRYAPSPTGLQHVGSLRTALFNYLFASSMKGSFILRIEDTDRSRSKPEFEANIYDSFSWLGFRWTEGPDCGGPFTPYTQSERNSTYQAAARELVRKDAAYYCFCTDERLAGLREEQVKSKSPHQGYDRHCRNLAPSVAQERVDKGERQVVRLKIPEDGSVSFNDLLLGRVEWQNKAINPDPILLKTDGFPTYHLANVVDDHAMAISHVMRAQEWLASTPFHIHLYQAFGWTAPLFIHLPMVLGKDGQKLSKRHGATSIDEFRRHGYLPEALCTYVAHLGASYEEGREIFTLTELAERFRLEKLSKSPAIFDYEKLDWFNQQYIMALKKEKFADLVLPFLQREGLKVDSMDYLASTFPLVRERLLRLEQAPGLMAYLFQDPHSSEASLFLKNHKKAITLHEVLRHLLEEGTQILHNGDKLAQASFIATLESSIREQAQQRELKAGDLFMTLRLAITGNKASPPLIDSMAVLGLEASMRRLWAVVN